MIWLLVCRVVVEENILSLEPFCFTHNGTGVGSNFCQISTLVWGEQKNLEDNGSLYPNQYTGLIEVSIELWRARSRVGVHV